MSDIALLRQKYPKFIFEKFAWKEKDANIIIHFSYSIPPDLRFTHTVQIPASIRRNIAPKVLDSLVFHLGLVEMFSYWKVTASPQITIKAGSLDEKQTAWWKKLLLKGMGEFFYKNQLNLKKESEDIHFGTTCLPAGRLGILKTGSQRVKNAMSSFPVESEKDAKYLLLFGGGKDSLVAYEILKKAGKIVVPLWVNPLPNKNEILRLTGLSQFIEVKGFLILI